MNDITQEVIDDCLKNPNEFRYSLLGSFLRFVRVFHFYMHRKQFVVMPFHRKIIKKLEDMVFGRNEKLNLYLGIAPRYGKSQIVIYFIAYSYAINGQCNFLNTSYGSDLITKFSGQIKEIINSELYRKLFGIRIASDTSAKDLWKIDNGGEFRATSLGGVITGFGAGIIEDGWGGAIMIDDFMKAGDYNSNAIKSSVIDCYKNTLKSRRNNPKTPIIIIAQRLAKDDLIGWLMDNEPEDWEFFIQETLDEETGEVLWPDKHTRADLEKMKKNNPFLFYSQYQQKPIILGGSVIKTEWFGYYPLVVKYDYNRLFMTGDTAQKVKQANDWSVFCLWGTTPTGELHLIDMIRGKWEAPELRRQAVDFWERYKNGLGNNGVNCSAFYVEDKSSGTGLIQDLRVSTGIPIIGLQRNTDKLTRTTLS